MKWGIIVSVAAAAVGGLAYYLLADKPEESKPETVIDPTSFFENPIAGFDDEIEDFVLNMNSEEKNRFYEVHDKFLGDLEVLWLREDHPEFAWHLNYFGVCLSLMFFVINKRKRGIELPEFESCMVETVDIYRSLCSVVREEIEKVYPVLRERGVRHQAFKLLGMVLAHQQTKREERHEFRSQVRHSTRSFDASGAVLVG